MMIMNNSLVLGVSNSDGKSIDAALDLEKSKKIRLVHSALELPNDLDGDTSSLRQVDVGDTVVLDLRNSFSSVEESNILEDSSNLVAKE